MRSSKRGYRSFKSSCETKAWILTELMESVMHYSIVLKIQRVQVLNRAKKSLNPMMVMFLNHLVIYLCIYLFIHLFSFAIQ